MSAQRLSGLSVIFIAVSVCVCVCVCLLCVHVVRIAKRCLSNLVKPVLFFFCPVHLNM